MGEIISCINAQNEKKLTFGLCICERIINEQAIQLFASSILEDKALTILSFVHCEFTSYDCMKLLGNSIKLSGITSLNFSHTNLSQQSFQTMIESFSNNSIITELFLDSTNISNEYIPILCGLLKTTKTLRIIDLTNNNIQEEGIKSLISTCKDNVFIIDLRIKDNPGSTNENLNTLYDILVRNKSVVRVIDKIIKQTFVQLTLKRRVAQTTAILGRTDRANASDSNLLNQRSGDREVTRGRARGGTIDMSVVPVHILTATSAEEPLEDCGNSPSKRFIIGSSHTRGRRKDMQDAILLQGSFAGNPKDDLFCVFDGHGSQDSAIFVAKNLPKILQSKLESGLNEIVALCETFNEIDELLRPVAIHHGTTAVVCLIRDNILYTANLGDSRAVLCRNKEAIRLTVDHKPDLPGETKRIERMGGFVRNNRVQGSLAVTRSFGDYFAGELVSSEPYLTVTPLNKSDDYLLIACDGLFDIFTDDVAITIANGFNNPQDAAVKLKDQAFASGSTDNISVIIVNFNNQFSSIDESPDHAPAIKRGLWLSSSDESEDSAVEEDEEEDEEEEEEEDRDHEQEQNDPDDE